MQVILEFDRASTRSDIRVAKAKFQRATIAAFNRMGLFVEARAVIYVAVNTGRTRGDIHSRGAEHNRAMDTVTVTVEAGTAYSRYIELGFKGHFVPFHVAPDLYTEALSRWGWRVPGAGDIPKGPNSGGKRWLIPRGRKRPVWGVFVSGRAQPFLRPALDDLMRERKYLDILREEYGKVVAG